MRSFICQISICAITVKGEREALLPQIEQAQARKARGFEQTACQVLALEHGELLGRHLAAMSLNDALANRQP